MRSFCLASAVFLASSPVALAAGADSLADALGKFPQMILTNPEPVQAYFVNMETLRAIGREASGDQRFGQQRLDFAMIDALTPLIMGGVETWESNAGIALADVRYFAGMGVPPYTVSVWGLDDDATATGITEHLSTLDFEPVGSQGVLGNGEPLNTDLQSREIGNPWRDELGRATFVGQSGDALIQSTTPQAVEVFLDEGETAADHPVIATSLGALNAITNAGVVVQAMVISPTFGLQGADFGAITLTGSTDMDELRGQIEAEMETAGQGIPPYFGGIVADVQNEWPTLAITLVYPDCKTAQTAVEMIEQRWTGSNLGVVPTTVETGTLEGPEGLCAGAVAIIAENEGVETNPISRAVFSAYMSRRFDLLNIGQAPQ